MIRRARLPCANTAIPALAAWRPWVVLEMEGGFENREPSSRAKKTHGPLRDYMLGKVLPPPLFHQRDCQSP